MEEPCFFASCVRAFDGKSLETVGGGCASVVMGTRCVGGGGGGLCWWCSGRF